MKTFSLALRNLLRNQRRSLTTVLAMTVGLVAILLFGGYRSNIMNAGLTGFVQYSGHLQIQRKNYFRDGGDNPTAYGVADYQHIIDVVRSDPVLAPMLNVVTPTLQLGGIAGNYSAGASRSVMAIGVVPSERNQQLNWNDLDIISYARPLPLTDTADDNVVVGAGVARKLKLCNALHVPDCTQAPTPSMSEGAQAPDDIAALSSLEQGSRPRAEESRIEMLAATAHGAPNVASLNVIRADNMGMKALDDIYMAMHLRQAQRLIYGATPPQVTAINVQLKHTDQMRAAQARLALLLANEFKAEPLEVLDFATLNPSYDQTTKFMNSIFGFVASLIGVIVLFTISNTMSTAVVERTTEIGTLRAMGLRRSGIRRLFMCEALLLGVIGSVIGVLGALLIAYAINHSGMTWIPPNYSIAYLLQVRVWQDQSLMISSVIGMILVTIISAWWPANRAAKLMIVDALRHV